MNRMSSPSSYFPFAMPHAMKAAIASANEFPYTTSTQSRDWYQKMRFRMRAYTPSVFFRTRFSRGADMPSTFTLRMLFTAS